MRGVAFAFFASGSVAVLAGMVWGIQMSVTHDHGLAAAHAHLNLVGWVTLGLFGLYYAQTPAAAQSRLAWVHLALAIGGVVLMVPGIVLAIRGGNPALAAAGSMLTLASMVVFFATVLRHGLGGAQ
jgi:hypothetical protein